MSQDRLLEATRALRSVRGGGSPGAGLTEERVIARVSRQARRTRRIVWLLPVAAVLAVSSAWAASQPELRTLVRETWTRLTGASEVPPVARGNHRSGSAPPLASAMASSAEPEAPLTATPTEELQSPPREPEPSVKPPSSGSNAIEHGFGTRTGAIAVAPQPAPSVSGSTAPNRALELYRRAHELHFKLREPQAALLAWDQYLAAAPSGPLALEARYNRAICLVQLGRREEARAALAPFARGDYGGYRQAEAAAILDGHGTLR